MGFQFPGLHQRQHFEKFVHGSETAGENDDRLGQIEEPEFAHEEVVELEIQLSGDVRIVELLHRQRNIEPGVDTGGFRGAPVGGFHGAGTAAGTDDKAAIVALQVL